MYEGFAKWLDGVMDENSPIPGAAVNFNLYEEEDGDWSAQLVSAAVYDAENDDWCCDELFTTGEDIYLWHLDGEWEEAEEQFLDAAARYLEEGKYAGELKKFEAVTAGFVDGDLTVLYTKD